MVRNRVQRPYRGNQVADLPGSLGGTWQQVGEHEGLIGWNTATRQEPSSITAS